LNPKSSIFLPSLVSSQATSVVGADTNDGSEETLGGYFTLTWRKIKGKWLIVADHTS
jgi:ketosteroid isomerase-like protein